MRIAVPRAITVPGREAIVVAAVTAFLFFAAANLQAGWMYAVDAILMGMLTAGWLSAAWSVRGVAVERSVSAEVHEGDDVRVVVQVQTRRIPRFFLEVTDQPAGLPAYRQTVPMVWPGRPVLIRYVATAPRRGIYREGTVTVESTGLTGWFRARRSLAAGSSLTVLPVIWPLGDLRLSGHRASGELVTPRPVRTGLEVSGVRDYRDGEGLRHVHWRSTARRGHLVIREYEHDGHDATVVLLDARRGGGHAGVSADVFEDLVRAAASVADALARRGEAVRIASTTDGVPVLVGPGRAAVLRWLAGVRAGGSVRPAEVYETVCASGTPVLILTGDAGSVAPFAAAGIPHTALVVGDGDDVRAQLAAL